MWINDKDEDFNADAESKKLLDYLDEFSSHYITDELFVPFGDDFRYMNAEQNFVNMDRMITYMNANYGDRYKFIYSTPSKWVDAVNKLNVKWPTKYDDMFPYSDCPDCYWTSYFTSRPNSKGYIRRGSHNLHATTNLYAEKMFDQNLKDEQLSEILGAKKIMLDELGINQHHDAVSGTEKQAVSNDYDMRIFKAMKQNNAAYDKVLNERMKLLSGLQSTDQWRECVQTNSTYLDCPIA